MAGWIILQPRTPTLPLPPQPRGQWGLKLLLFFRPGRQDDKDSIPLGLLTPGCTAEVENGRQWGWGGDRGRGVEVGGGGVEGGGGRWDGGDGQGFLYRKLILWNFLLVANGDL